MWFKQTYSVISACAIGCAFFATAANGGDFWKLEVPFTAPAKAAHREKPETCADPPVEQLANQIDWLEHYIDEFGTIVPKQPDVWGQSRLTQHREEYERTMATQLNNFAVTFQGSLARNDMAYVAFSMALQGAAAKPPAPPRTISKLFSGGIARTATGPTVNVNESVTSPASPSGSSGAPTATPPPFAFGNPTGSANFTPPFGLNSQTQMAALGFSPTNLSLEPTMMLDELSGYLNHLHELRRINEGSDTNDSPGYALDLVRVPISVLPGKKTRKGYGAEITITARPYLTRELLPETFRDLVANDLVDLLAPALTQWVNDPEMRQFANGVLKAEEALADLTAIKDRFTDEKTFALKKQEILQSPESIHLSDDVQNALRTAISAGDLKVKADFMVASASQRFVRATLRKAPRPSSAPGTRTRRAYMPIPPSQIIDVFGPQMAARMIYETNRALSSNPLDRGVIQISDVRSFLSEEVNASYLYLGWQLQPENCLPQAETIGPPAAPDFQSGAHRGTAHSLNRVAGEFPVAPDPPAKLGGVVPAASGGRVIPVSHTGEEVDFSPATRPQGTSLWESYCTPTLAIVVRERRMFELHGLRGKYLFFVGCESAAGGACDCSEPLDLKPQDTTGKSELNAAPPILVNSDGYPICKTLTVALGWGLLVESSLLNEQLNEDYRQVLSVDGASPAPDCNFAFFGPNPPANSRDAFVDYVRRRWPIRVFSLDPVDQQQNIEDAYSRRRELQIALAMGFASGTLGVQGLLQASRRLETDMATVALNQTAIGFSHCDDTFGWRFYPRYQTPPFKGNVSAFWESIAGGPTTEQDMRERELEPMQRECVAIVVMPSFVPNVVFESRSRFFRITDPKCTEISMRQTMMLSRSIKAMEQSAAQCSACASLYRDGDVAQLLNRVHQLEQTLPLQSTRVPLPFENTSGGFELFNRGVTDLSPELVGWFGAPGIYASTPTTLFLVGKGYSVNGMQLIAGGRSANFTMLSRQVLEATIPPGVPYVVDDGGNRLVDVRVATPYGVSNSILVPVAPAPVSPPAAIVDLGFAASQSVDFYYTAGAGPTGNTFKLANYQSVRPYIEIALPQATPALVPTLNATLYFNDPNSGVTGTQSNVTFVYSAATGKYGTPLDPLILPPSTTNMGALATSYLAANYGSTAPPADPIVCRITAVLPGGGTTPVINVGGYVNINLRKQ